MKALLNKTKTWLNTNNHLLWTSIIALIVIGLMGVYFIGPYQATMSKFEPNIFFNKFWPFALAGTVILFAFSKLSRKWIVRISWVFGIIGLLLMLKTIIDPTVIFGSARYVKVGSAYVDPFMLSLPAYIVLMSHWLSKEKANRILTAIGTTLLTLFIVGTAFVAPYVFMAQIYLLVFVLLVCMSRKTNPGLFKIGIATFAGFVVLMAIAFFTMPHVHARIELMFEPQMYSQKWIALQALSNSAIIGNTTESIRWLATLPDSMTDYMLTSMIAKFGILVGLLVLALYGCIAKGLTNTIQTANDKFSKLLTTGTFGLFAIYIIAALGVAFGFVRAAAWWPFIGFGGTMFLTWCILFGFMFAVNRKVK